MPTERSSTTQEAQFYVTVKVFGALRDRFGAGAREISLHPPGTLRGLLSALSVAVPDLVPKLEEGLADGYLNVLVNGRNATFLDNLDTILDAGDTVAFLPPVGGG